MSVQWSENLSIGHDGLDHQHQELFQVTSMLDHAIHSHDVSKLNDILHFLEDYVVSHFKDEEDFMLKTHYDEYDFHKKEHDQFKKTVEGLRNFYDSHTSNTHIIFKIRQCIDEMILHIITVDSKLTHHE